ncbi:MAG: hypothetical protein IKS42_10630 [Oscillospiraceae bacterium]|jgi:hypothetical protein|nr:hypothetical protein [Oscillospiraceae bacterium]
METNVLLTSETQAEKAKRVLAAKPYRFHVAKTTTPSGCAFRLSVDAPPSAVLPLLAANRIPFRL